MNYLKFLFTIIAIISILGCKSKSNQMINHLREGRWITIDTLDVIYTIKGRYKKGIEIGAWRHFSNDRIVRKEKYSKNGICKIIFYHPNGKIMKKGNTKMENTTNETHWYYFGKWRFYNTKGGLDSVSVYKKENFTDSLKVKN